MRRVLIVEVDAQKRRWLYEAAAVAGCAAETTDTWASALALLASRSYDLIVGTDQIPNPPIGEATGPAGVRRFNVVRLSIRDTNAAPPWLPLIFASSALAAAAYMASQRHPADERPSIQFEPPTAPRSTPTS